jgi:hypothetical protein
MYNPLLQGDLIVESVIELIWVSKNVSLQEHSKPNKNPADPGSPANFWEHKS